MPYEDEGGYQFFLPVVSFGSLLKEGRLLPSFSFLVILPRADPAETAAMESGARRRGAGARDRSALLE